MGQSNWNEEKIIHTLHDFPKVEDSQTKDELFEKIQTRMDKRKKRRRSFRIMPMIAVACILLIAAIISPGIFEKVFDSDHHESPQGTINPDHPKETKDGAQKIQPFSKKETPKTKSDPEVEGNPESNKIIPKAFTNKYNYYSGLQKAPNDRRVITVYYPDKKAMNLVPVSILSNKGDSRVKGLQTALDEISPDELGISQSDLKNVKLSENTAQNALVLDMEPNTVQGSTGTIMFLNAVKYTAYELGYEKIDFKTNGKDGYDFPHKGHYRQVKVESPDKGVATLLTDKGALLLVKGASAMGENEPSTFEQAIQRMQHKVRGNGFRDTIQKSVFIKDVTDKGDMAIIELSKGSKLEDNLMFLAMIESILLTAHQFEYEQVKIDGANIDHIGPYQLKGPIPVIKAPNIVKQ